jgi:hypothetical protein
LPLDHPIEALRPAIQRLDTDSELCLSSRCLSAATMRGKKSSEIQFIHTIDCCLQDEAALLGKFADDRHISFNPDTVYKTRRPRAGEPEGRAPLVVGFGLCVVFCRIPSRRTSNLSCWRH